MKLRLSTISLNVVTWVGGLLVAIPFLWMILSSFKTQGEIFSSPFSFPHNLAISNYTTLFKSWPFGNWFLNSVWITAIVTALTLLFASLGGFGFSKYRFKGKSWLFAIVIASMAIPFQSILIPLYGEMGKFHLVNNYASLILPFMAPPLGIFLMRQFMGNIPDELLESARMDGCSELMIYLRIVLPLLKPALGALAVITFIMTWSNFLWPLVMINNTSKFTLPLGLYSLMGDTSSGGTAQYGNMFAGAVLASVPPVLLFIFMQRSFVRGLTMGGVKD